MCILGGGGREFAVAGRRGCRRAGHGPGCAGPSGSRLLPVWAVVRPPWLEIHWGLNAVAVAVIARGRRCKPPRFHADAGVLPIRV